MQSTFNIILHLWLQPQCYFAFLHHTHLQQFMEHLLCAKYYLSLLLAFLKM